MTTEAASRAFRILPRLDGTNDHYWQGGEHGELRILRCDDDGTWIHPPAPMCPVCFGRSLTPQATSGTGVVHTFTINHQPWYPGLEPPYVVAIVALPEQDGLRITAGLVDVAVEDVRIDLPVRVVFEHREDVWLPFFTPAEGGDG